MWKTIERFIELSLPLFLFLFLSSHCFTSGCLLQELLLSPRPHLVLRPASCLVSPPSPSLLFSSCFFFGFPCLTLCFNLSFPKRIPSLRLFGSLFLNHPSLHFLPWSVLQPPAHTSSPLFTNSDHVFPAWYFSCATAPSLPSPLIDATSTWHLGGVSAGALDVLSTCLSTPGLAQRQQRGPRRTRTSSPSCSGWEPCWQQRCSPETLWPSWRCRGANGLRWMKKAMYWPQNFKTEFAVSQLSCVGGSEPLIAPCS